MSSAVLKRRRDTVTASIASLATKLTDSVTDKTDPVSLSIAQSLTHKLESLDAELHAQHYKILDLIDEADADTSVLEQKVLDQHDDEVTTLKARLATFIESCSLASCPSTDPNLLKVTTCKLTRLEKNLESISGMISKMTDPVDLCLLQQHDEQLRDLKLDLTRAADDLLTIDLTDDHALLQLHAKLEEHVFDCGLRIKKTLAASIVIGGWRLEIVLLKLTQKELTWIH